jgi:hypothetical protein
MFAGLLAFVNVAHANHYDFGNLENKKDGNSPSLSFKDGGQLSKEKFGSHEENGKDGDRFKSKGDRSGAYTPIAAAVPEPETYTMILAGLGLIGFAARRRNRNV